MPVVTPDVPAVTQRIAAGKYLTFVPGNESCGMAKALLDIDRGFNSDTVTRLAMAATPVAALTCQH